MKIYLLFTVLLIFFVLPAPGQIPSASSTSEPDEPIRVSTLLVNVPVIAADRRNQSIQGLTKDNFLVTEDGERRAIEYFADVRTPMNVVILVDCSVSIKPFLSDIKSAARDFIKTVRSDDRVLIAGFDDRPFIFSEFTSDQKKLQQAVGEVSVSIRPGSNMQDSINELLAQRFSRVKGRKAIIVLTDGDVGGQISNAKLLSILAESDVLIYPVIFDGEPAQFSAFDAFKMGRSSAASAEAIDKTRVKPGNRHSGQYSFMNSLATVTGGKLYERETKDFKTIFQHIADELKNQYLIGFYPQNVGDGKTHRILVETSSQDIIIRTKQIILSPRTP